MTTLILTPRHTEDTQALWRAATRRGWSVERLASWRLPEHLCGRADLVIYAEAMFGPELAQQAGLALISPPDDWLVRLPAVYKQREVMLTTLALARQCTQPRFVKPPADKSFPAAVYRGDELPQGFDEDSAVLVSDVVGWDFEFRCFVRERKLVTYSLYSRGGELQRDAEFRSSPEEDAGLERFFEQLAADPRVDLPPAVVVDIGHIAGKGWACVELNAAWGAGLYACDAAAVLDVIRAASIPLAVATSAETDADSCG